MAVKLSALLMSYEVVLEGTWPAPLASFCRAANAVDCFEAVSRLQFRLVLSTQRVILTVRHGMKE
jgi:hypothetical protein